MTIRPWDNGPQKLTDLNDAGIQREHGYWTPLRPERVEGGPAWGRHSFADLPVEIHFQKLDEALAIEIRKHPIVVGCMAWLTSPVVLDALATRKMVSMIIQKEDFLRPDSGDWSRRGLRKRYAALPAFDGTNLRPGGLNYDAEDMVVDAVRCVGMTSTNKKRAMPRMHHKFMVFCEESKPGSHVLSPRAFWTGSFNATNNGVKSLENAIVVRHEDAARAYEGEWTGMLGISEPLDWESPHVHPEYYHSMFG